MSIYIATGPEGTLPSFLASNTGWADFRRWVDTIRSDCPELYHLCKFGWVQKPYVVLDELTRKQSSDTNVLRIANSLAEKLTGLGEDDPIMIH
jgi:hypothetical protein